MNPRQAAQAALAAPTYRYIQGAMLVVLVIAFTTSFESGSEGAKRLGYPEDFIAALPLVCDVIAGVATFIHGRVRKDAQMRRLSAQFVLVPMLLSWGANSVDHVNRAGAGDWATAGVIAWYTGVVIGAGICPVAVAALLHLSTKYVDFEQRQTERVVSRTKATASAPPPNTAPPALPQQVTREPLHAVGAQPSMSAQVRAWIHAELDAGRDVTGADADKQFGLEGSARCGARALAKVLKDRERQAV